LQKKSQISFKSARIKKKTQAQAIFLNKQNTHTVKSGDYLFYKLRFLGESSIWLLALILLLFSIVSLLKSFKQNGEIRFKLQILAFSMVSQLKNETLRPRTIHFRLGMGDFKPNQKPKGHLLT
jgi:hypothetical protein